MGKNSNALKAIYAPFTLREIALWAKTCLRGPTGDLEFSKIQKKIIESAFPGFSFDFLTTSTIICDDEMMPIATNVLCLDIATALADGYGDVAHLDDMSPASYLNTGRTIYSGNVRSYEEWQEHPFYTMHCKQFDIARSMTLSFQNPERRRTYLAFEYLGSSDNHSWGAITHQQLELATFPFALAWFYRKDFMDDAALDRRFCALEGMTDAQLIHVRKFINGVDLSLKHQAEELGISSNWLKESLYSVRNNLAGKFNWDLRSSKSSQSSLRPLERELRMFEMLGDPQDQIILPPLLTI